ncbi:hypothetical protein F5Y16DRAFT_379642 [Xylariaceae sp. FL0255]|nr:hypothetical protein F5Y16DRAFT_379642 [Xylariaceae sp. FL0255]
MVSYSEVQASNARISDATVPRVAVFPGGTSGIGSLTARALASTGTSVKIYIVGRRSAEARTRTFIEEMKTINPKAEIIWAEAEISLLAEVKRICRVIKSKESRVDLLFLTAGYAAVGARQETSEGIEITQSLEYYSRMLFIQHLLPLLRQSEHARIVSVCAGGTERASSIVLDDLDLKNPKNFTLLTARPHVAALITVTMDKMAALNPDVTFIHSMPGWVATGNVNRGYEPGSKWGFFVWIFLGPLIKLFSMSLEVSGQKNLFQSTSAAFGGRGTPWDGPAALNTKNEPANGLFLVNHNCNSTPNAKVIAILREKAQVKVWNHTQDMLGPYL